MTGPGVPVVVDLADWSRSTARRLRFPRVRRPPVSPRPLVVWLRATVRERYGIPALVFDAWLAEDRLVLLLDGLDEVPKAHREQCVNEINKLQQSGGHHMVVCSRTRNYESLETQLKLQGAVEIQPLGWEQVAAFLDAGGPRLRAMAPGLAADRELLDVLTTSGSGRMVPHRSEAETGLSHVATLRRMPCTTTPSGHTERCNYIHHAQHRLFASRSTAGSDADPILGGLINSTNPRPETAGHAA
jgi:hypothetical protein